MMSELTTLKRRRGSVKASITRLTSKLTELEGMDFDQSVSSQAQQLLKRLESLDTSFKTHNMAILDAIEESQVEAEQETLDEHDDDVMNISLRLQALTTLTLSRLDLSLIVLSLVAVWRSCKRDSCQSQKKQIHSLEILQKFT